MNELYHIFAGVIIVGFIYFRYKWPSIKGKLGERGVVFYLSFLNKNKYTVLNDLIYRNGDRSTQIDHVVVSTRGIFVIETKNYKGSIYGSEHKDYWMHTLGRHRYSLYNPIIQNENHIRFLMRKFPYICERKQCIHSIVVFLNTEKLKLSGDCSCGVRLKNLNYYITSFRRVVLSQEECSKIVAMLRDEQWADPNAERKHLKNVKAAVNEYERKVSQGICPRCGGELIRSKGKYGTFLGCSNYPNCKYTH